MVARRAPSGKDAPADVAQVYPYAVNTTDERSRTLFRGSEKTARAYVVNHHPYLHVNPGDDWGIEGPMPDVVLVGPDGLEEFWNGEDWVKDPVPDEPVEKAPPVQADIPAGTAAHWNGSEWVVTEDDSQVPDDTGVITEQVYEAPADAIPVV